MHAEGPGYALIGDDGIVFHIAATYDEALEVASRANSAADIWYEGPPPWEEHEPEPAAMAANAGTLHRIGRKGESDPERALRLLGLTPMTDRQILDVDLEDAFDELRKFFPTKSQQGYPASTYSSSSSMIDHFFGTNHKIAKPTSRGALKGMSTGLNMMPAQSWESPQAQEIIRLARSFYGIATVRPPPSGVTTCANFTPQCSASCLVYSGRNHNKYATIKKFALTTSLVHKPLAFMRMLYAALAAWQKKCECDDATPYVRLNVYSDMPWELLAPDMFERFSKIRFYDYTKVPGRMNMVNGRYPIENYDLTFSYSGTKANLLALNTEIEKNKRRVAVTFATIGTSDYVAPGGELIPTEPPVPGPKGTEPFWPQTPEIGLPKMFMGLPVVDGDRNDFRPLDPHPCVVGLRWKTPKKQRITAKEARIFIVPGYLVSETDPRFVVMDLPRYKDVFESENRLPWQNLDFSHVTVEEEPD